MRKYSFLAILFVVLIGGFLINSKTVLAYYVSFGLSTTGSGDTVQVSVNSDLINSNVSLSYTKNGYGGQTQYLGTTDNSGRFVTTVNSSTYGIVPGSLVRVVVNGQQSSELAWPAFSSYGSLSLSQSNLTLSVGQSAVINAYNTNGYTVYISSNSNSSVASAVTSGGNQITITGNTYGSTTISVCAQSGSICSSVYVNVQSNGYNNNTNNNSGSIALSQSNVSVPVGQSSMITIGGGSQPYTMYPNGQNIFQPVISGNSLNIIGLSSGTGTLNVCSVGGQGSGCTMLYITIGSSNNNNNNSYVGVSPVTFSQYNSSLTTGQSVNINLYGGTGSGYYVAYNSNASAVQASLNGSAITLTALSTSSATSIVVCRSSTSCGAISININPNGYSGSYNNYQGNWTSCGNEGGQCYFSGTQLVRYGANGSYFYRTLSGPVSCSNSVFGDPLFGMAKQCSYGGTR